MKPSRAQKVVTVSRLALVTIAFAMLSACEQNTFVPPPPPKVDVAAPCRNRSRAISTPPATPRRSRSVDLVARVQGFLQAINYKDGSFEKTNRTR